MHFWVGRLATPKKGKGEGGPYHREIPRTQPTAKDGADSKQYQWGYWLCPDAGGPMKVEDTV